ncbi:hypothetical protein JCM33774_79340 [Actinophytocola sp. KF-1]
MGPCQCTRNKRPATAATAIDVLRRAPTWITDHGVPVERVLSDNGSCHGSHTRRDTRTDRAPPPQANHPSHA